MYVYNVACDEIKEYFLQMIAVIQFRSVIFSSGLKLNGSQKQVFWCNLLLDLYIKIVGRI
jgi:hypothetical protein